MADPNGPVFTTGHAPAHAFSQTRNDRTALYNAREFIRRGRSKRDARRTPLERVAWYCAGLVTGGGLAAVVMAGTAVLTECAR